LLNEQPDVIVLENALPDMSGLRVCHLLQQLRAYHDIPLLLLSEPGSLAQPAAAREAGAFEGLHKPFDIEVLRERIQAALRLRHQNLQLQKLFQAPVALPAQSRDPLTGLPGAALLKRRIQGYYSEKVSELSLTLVDLDFFRYYAEAFGQAQSEGVLQRLAKALTRLAPEAEVFRCSDDSFALLASPQTRCAALQLGQQICERVRLMAIPHAALSGLAYLSVSVGTVTIGDTARPGTQDLLDAAEQALFQAKTWGRAQVRQFLAL
jgi:diguanylate cyclase (GGDEF)-like protein